MKILPFLPFLGLALGAGFFLLGLGAVSAFSCYIVLGLALIAVQDYAQRRRYLAARRPQPVPFPLAACLKSAPASSDRRAA